MTDHDAYKKKGWQNKISNKTSHSGVNKIAMQTYSTGISEFKSDTEVAFLISHAATSYVCKALNHGAFVFFFWNSGELVDSFATL